MTFRDDEFGIDIVIAPRQSGKTMMLVDNAIQYIVENNSNVYMVAITNHIRTIVDEVVRELPYRSDILRKICYINSYDVDYVGHNTRVYFDESDFIDNIPLIKNAYYTTTPTTGRTNSFINVLESGEYNVFGRLLAAIIPMDFEI
jgi:predicted AAA+ superfamily ATPase